MKFKTIVWHGFNNHRLGKFDFGKFIVLNVFGIAVYFTKAVA